MTCFPSDKKKWYELRDDRTRRVDGVAGFDNFSLGIVIGSPIDSPAIQVMALTALKILARWCRKIKINLPPETICSLPNHKNLYLKDVLMESMLSADPYGQFVFGNVTEADFDQILILGQAEQPFKQSHVRINGSGWIAGVSFGNYQDVPFHGNERNIVGPAFAACLGVAEIFRQAIGLPHPHPYSTWYSLFDFSKAESFAALNTPKSPFPPDFGRVYQIGCGAVGSSLDFFFSLTDWRGIIDLIDYDQVVISNCNRSLSFSACHAINGQDKVHVCADILNYSHFSTSPFKGSFNDFVGAGKYLDTPPDLILCLANEDQVWAAIQNNFPPLLLHATTTPNLGLNFGRHIPKKEWCILCRFSREMAHAFVPPCGEGVISSNEKNEPIQGVLPFLSPAAAVLILAEMAKMQMDNYPVNHNFIQFSLKSPGNSFIKLKMGPQSGCICNEQSMEYYPQEVKNSKFWRSTRG
jgi:hypothetical protein